MPERKTWQESRFPSQSAFSPAAPRQGAHVGGGRLEAQVGAHRGQSLRPGTQRPRRFVSAGTAAGRPGPPGRPAAPPAASASRCGSAPAATPRRATGAACAWGRTARRGGCRPAPHVRARAFPHARSASPSVQLTGPRPSLPSSSSPFGRSLGWTAPRGARAWAQFPRAPGVRAPGAPQCSAPRAPRLRCCKCVGERPLLLNSTRSASKPTVLCRT